MGNITVLKQGSLNGLRRQINECLDRAYNKGYEDGKKEYPEKAYYEAKIDEAKQEGYDIGLEIGKKQAIAEIPEVANKENEMYNKGLEDVNHAMDVLENMTESEREEWFENYWTVGEIVRTFTIQRILESTKAYEKKKQTEEIKVGDIVKFNKKCHSYETKKNREFLVLHKFDNGMGTLLYDNGDTGVADIILLDKTGRHIDETEQLLDKLKGDK